MVLMIFVNDLWSLEGIPGWLEHVSADADGMGLADWVFPGFLFIVGLSIPFALQARLAKGEGRSRVFFHILLRSIALWVMGLMMVNLEMTSDALLPIPKAVWQILMIVGFFLVWNRYPGPRLGRLPVWVWQGFGVGLLLVLAALYRGGTADEPTWMRFHWWGILGLIGWGYLAGATVWLWSRGSLLVVSLATLVFFVFNALECLPVSFQPSLVVGAANYATVLLGVWVATYLTFHDKHDRTRWAWTIGVLALAVVLLVYGFATRPIWGISKIQGTPSWVAICGGVSALGFLLLYGVCDGRGFTRWARPVEPAGRSTLTCYLIPYVVYGIMSLGGWWFPEALSMGAIGLLKSLCFALLIVQMTRGLERFGVRVRI